MTLFGTAHRTARKRLAAVIGVVGLAAGSSVVAGAPAGAQAAGPVGHVDSVEVAANQVSVVGWAADAGSPNESTKVDLYVDGEYAATAVAKMARPDVAAVFPAYGSSTGFEVSTTLAQGTHQVCAHAISNSSLNERLGCAEVTAQAPSAEQPVGFLDSVSVDDQLVSVSGWAVHPATPESTTVVDVFVDGDYAATASTGDERADVAAAFPAYGSSTGFDIGFGIADGDHSICAFAISESTLNTRLGCKSVTVSGTTGMRPVGYLDTAVKADGGVSLAGWAADPSSPDRDVAVDVFVDGEYNTTLTADEARPDVAAVIPAYGPSTGFSASVGLSAGAHRVCVFAFDEDTLNTRLGCKSVDIEGAPDVQPSGNVDAVLVGSDQVRVVGWAADAASPDRDVSVDIYIDGAYAATGTSDGARPDVESAYPAYGATTGFDVTADITAGDHRVCAYAIDEAALNTLLLCATVSIES